VAGMRDMAASTPELVSATSRGDRPATQVAGVAGARRAVAGVGTGLLLVACLGSGARAAWVGLAAAGLVVLAARAGSVVGAARAHPRRVALGAAGLVVAAVAVLALTPVGGRLSSVTDPDAAGGRGRL